MGNQIDAVLVAARTRFVMCIAGLSTPISQWKTRNGGRGGIRTHGSTARLWLNGATYGDGHEQTSL